MPNIYLSLYLKKVYKKVYSKGVKTYKITYRNLVIKNRFSSNREGNTLSSSAIAPPKSP